MRIVTATFGDSNVKDQAVWLELSRIASQTTLEGEHVIYRDNPEGVVEEVQTTLEAIQAGE